MEGGREEACGFWEETRGSLEGIALGRVWWGVGSLDGGMEMVGKVAQVGL